MERGGTNKTPQQKLVKIQVGRVIRKSRLRSCFVPSTRHRKLGPPRQLLEVIAPAQGSRAPSTEPLAVPQGCVPALARVPESQKEWWQAQWGCLGHPRPRATCRDPWVCRQLPCLTAARSCVGSWHQDRLADPIFALSSLPPIAVLKAFAVWACGSVLCLPACVAAALRLHRCRPPAVPGSRSWPCCSRALGASN